ncbi:MAG: hypothetical protein HY900_22655 [Deltaproteobacteria bacterium]|nr:hypothetical protein [Deltaproteobacteria bacterium]
MPDRDLGEQVCAYVVCSEGHSLTHEELLAYLQGLGTAKALQPAWTEFVRQIPLTAAGKADRKALRSDLEAKLKAQRSA